MIKTMIVAALFGAAVYAALFVDLGGKNLVAHLRDVWSTPVVQEKVENLKDGVKGKIEKRLAEAAAKGKEGRSAAAEVRDNITDADRANLFKVLEKAGVKR